MFPEPWLTYRSLRAHPKISYAPLNLSEYWDAFAPPETGSSNRWTDAYLSPISNAAEATLVTLDKRIHVPDNVNYLVLA